MTRVGTTAPGTSLTSSPLDIDLNAESRNQNAANTHATTSSGQAQEHTHRSRRPAPGPTLRPRRRRRPEDQYPQSDERAARYDSIKVASMIPLKPLGLLDRQRCPGQNVPGIDTSQTLGQIQSQAINPSGASPVTAGGPGAAPATGQPAPAPGGWAGQMASALKPLAGGKGGGAGGGGDSGGDQPQPMQLPQAFPARAVGGPMMMGPGGLNAPKPGAQDALGPSRRRWRPRAHAGPSR